jgi:hypothetical protein
MECLNGQLCCIFLANSFSEEVTWFGRDKLDKSSDMHDGMRFIIRNDEYFFNNTNKNKSIDRQVSCHLVV